VSPRADVRAVRRTGRDQSTLPTGFKRSWFTIAAPAKTPKEIIGRLNASVDKFLKTEDGIARLHKLGAEPAGGSAEDMQRYVVAETEKWARSQNSRASSRSDNRRQRAPTIRGARFVRQRT
jgi:hypothetical protein